MLADLFLSLAKKVVTAGDASFSVASPALARALGGSLLAGCRAICLSYRPVTHKKSSQFLPLRRLDGIHTTIYSN